MSRDIPHLSSASTREEVAAYCETLPGVYADTPFHDSSARRLGAVLGQDGTELLPPEETDDLWLVMRLNANKKCFAFIFRRENAIWVNVKLEPGWAELLRQGYSAIRPAYHMNKTHWSSIVLDGSVPDELVCQLLRESYRLCGGGQAKGAKTRK